MRCYPPTAETLDGCDLSVLKKSGVSRLGGGPRGGRESGKRAKVPDKVRLVAKPCSNGKGCPVSDAFRVEPQNSTEPGEAAIVHGR